MTISGFSFVRNGILFDYPFIESLQSILPLCDEFIIAVGNSSDKTLERIKSLHHPKIKIIETVWDESLRTGGTILAQQTDIALNHTSGDWAFYLQADEVVHEHDLPLIHGAMTKYLDDPRVEGLLFNYKHFYGSYRFVGNSRKWYRREVRVVKNRIGVRSWRDAQGFRIGSRKMRVKLIDASIYHYGWVKPPLIQQQKQTMFNRLWHSDSWVTEHVQQGEEYDYSNGGKLGLFKETHPSVMKERIEHQQWTFSYDSGKVKQRAKEALLNWIEEKSGYRFGEYKNYIIV
jgi:glycosyltransferase involved in cell wall biosynthesis